MLYIFNMETPVRNALINASKDYHYDLIKNLGPFSYVLQHIVAFANQKRPNLKYQNFHDKEYFKLFFGM